MKNVFRLVAFLEGISYILLLFVAVPLKYIGKNESYVQMLGMPHGLLFIAYLILAFLIKDSQKWNSKTFLWVLVASVIPFGTLYVDRNLVK